MFKLVLLFLTVSGLRALPIAAPLQRLQAASSTFQLPNGFQQDTDFYQPLPDGFRQGIEPSGLVEDTISEMHMGEVFDQLPLGNGHGEMERRHWLTEEIPDDVPVQRSAGGWVRVEEPAAPQLPDGFRQGTEPMMSIPDGFRQGTEPIMSIPDGFRQGTEPMSIPEGFRQGTEPMMSIPDGFRQGTEPTFHIPEGLKQGTEPMMSIPEGFRQGTEPMMSIPAGFRQGTEPTFHIPEGLKQGTEPMMSIPEGFRQGTEPMMSIPAGFRQGTEPTFHIPEGLKQETEPMMSIPDGFRQGTEPTSHIPEGFRQGTEPMMSIPDGFRQGTEPTSHIPEGFKQGTEPMMSIPDGFRQGTEPMMSIPSGFRQGTEPTFHMSEGFKQGTEPMMSIPDGFRQGTEPMMSIPDGFRQGTEPSASRIQEQIVACKGEVINGKCYEFNPTPMAFEDAQFSCRSVAPNAELASITNSDLHARLVSMVTNGGDTNPVLTWLGAMIEKQQASWVDGTEWNYSDWMPGHPNIHTDKPACLEMFHIDESWWTAADCELKRASICSYPIAA